MNRPLVFALLGAAAAAAGVFLPAVRVDLYGEIRYWDVATAHAVILLAGAAVALLSAWRGERVGLVAGALAMWGAVLWPWIARRFGEEPDRGLIAAAAKEIGDAAVGLAKDLAWQFTDLSWGMFAVGAGCLLVTLGALSRGGGGKGGKRGKPGKGGE